MKRWTIAAGESPRVYLINDGRDAVGEIVYTDTRRPEDARLIAAAPDLLDALCLALPFVEDHEGSEIYKPGAVAEAIRKIRAAIDKTEEAAA
jgi:hypothetical protein